MLAVAPAALELRARWCLYGLVFRSSNRIWLEALVCGRSRSSSVVLPRLSLPARCFAYSICVCQARTHILHLLAAATNVALEDPARALARTPSLLRCRRQAGGVRTGPGSTAQAETKDRSGAEPPSCEGSYSPLPSTANVKANRKIRMATMITNARRSRTQSPLLSLVVAPFYTNLDEPFYERGRPHRRCHVQCSNV